MMKAKRLLKFLDYFLAIDGDDPEDFDSQGSLSGKLPECVVVSVFSAAFS